MPSDKRNSITAKATGLIFSLFDVASARYNLRIPKEMVLCPKFINYHLKSEASIKANPTLANIASPELSVLVTIKC